MTTDILALPIDPALHRTDDEPTLGDYVGAILAQYLQFGEDFDVKRPLGSPRWGHPIDDALQRHQISHKEFVAAVRARLAGTDMAVLEQPTVTLDVRLLVEGTSTLGALADISQERRNQDAKWGEQSHPDGTGQNGSVDTANFYRRIADHNAQRGSLTWRHILEEEVYEALAETDPVKLREELIQVAATATVWVEHIDRRGKEAA